MPAFLAQGDKNMYTDMDGVKRLKINLHAHTTDSDGRMTPEEAARIYREAGYDVLAMTDHWHWRESGMLDGLRILSGAEYNIGGSDGAAGVYHILGLGCERRPDIAAGDQEPQRVLDAVHAAGGLAVLAHPAWSLNTVAQAAALHGIEATEIYNTVSDAHESCRPYSGNFVDIAAGQGLPYPLLATDDVHYYDGTDTTCSYIMLECAPDASDAELLQAVREKRFYATQGPEVHLDIVGDEAVVRCSPAARITLLSNKVWARGHSICGEHLTEHRAKLDPMETFIRAEVTDAQGKMAWSNTIVLK